MSNADSAVLLALCVWIAIAPAGMVFQQAAFRAGSWSASYPTMTVAKPVVAWLLGISVLSETLNADGPETFVLAIAAALTIAATAALARGEAVGVEAGTGGDKGITDRRSFFKPLIRLRAIVARDGVVGNPRHASCEDFTNVPIEPYYWPVGRP
jgi:hypothetical protein